MSTVTNSVSAADSRPLREIRVLIVDQSPQDAEQLVVELQKAGYVAHSRRVESEAAYLFALCEKPDLIISDYSLPQFDGLRAASLLAERGLDIPFIFVSGTAGEESAVKAIQNGAHDFLLKKSLVRLGSAVAIAFENKRLRDEAKRAEEKRRVAEDMFRNLAEHSLVGIQILQDGKYVYANSKIADIFGYTEAEILALDSWQQVVAPVDLPKVLDQVRRRESGELPRAHYIFRGLRKDGTVIDIEIRSDRIELQGRPAVMGMLIDISDRVRGEETLRVSEDRFRSAFELTNVPMVITELDHRFVRVNRAFARLFGYTQEEMLSASTATITHPDDLQESLARREALLSGEADYFQMEKRYFHRDGHVIWALVNVSLIRDSLGRPWQYVGQVQDITERRQALLELEQATEELRTANATIEKERSQLAERVAERTAELTAANAQLDQASRYKSEFLATMSHELRTPLNGILGMNELLTRTDLTPRQRQLVDVCTSSSKTLLQLINDVLDLSKIEAGKLELNPRECSLEALVYDVVTGFSLMAQQKGLKLSCDLDPQVCTSAHGDDHRVRQILVNFIGNAIKFTATGGITVRATYRKSDEHELVRFSVTDTGLGVPSEKCAQLFTPFSQLDGSTARHFGGTGLGLAICKQLAELMGGTVGMESQVGVGSTFWFEIPLQFTTGVADLARIRQALGGVRVLAVDGIDRDRRQIGDCLKAWGCPAVQVATARHGLEKVLQAEQAGNPFGVVLFDCRLVLGDEYIILQKLADHPNLPLICLCAEVDGNSSSYLMRLGVRHLLFDPVRPSALFNTLSSVLSVRVSDSEAPVASIEPVKHEPRVSGHLLVAEDNHINQMFIGELLKYCGCTCDLASNGDEALAILQRKQADPDQKQYDLVLMDCQMPETDGFVATREIRRREAAAGDGRHIPIIALTANALKGDRERCLDVGMDDYLTKPLQTQQLQKVLEKFLRK